MQRAAVRSTATAGVGHPTAAYVVWYTVCNTMPVALAGRMIFVSTLTSLVSPACAEDAGLKQTEVKILPWETRIEKLGILSHVSRNYRWQANMSSSFR